MTGEEIFREMTGIDSQLILNAAPRAKVNEKKYYKKWISLAACLAMIIGVLSYIIFHKTSSVSPIKPCDDSIMWAEDFEDGNTDEVASEKYDKTELNNIIFFEEKNISSSLYYALLSTRSNVFYGVIVTNRTESYLPIDEDIEFYNSHGIYAEIKNESLYIFVTQEQFKNLSLSPQQEQEYVFLIANRKAYKK